MLKAWPSSFINRPFSAIITPLVLVFFFLISIWFPSVLWKPVCSFWQRSRCAVRFTFHAVFTNCLKFLGVLSPFTPSYMRRGWTLCSTGLTCGLTSRENTFCTLCSHAAPIHSSSKVFLTVCFILCVINLLKTFRPFYWELLFFSQLVS